MRVGDLIRSAVRTALVVIFVYQGAAVSAQPRPRRAGITIKQIGIVGTNSVRIRRDPSTGNMYVLQQDGTVRRVNLGPADTATFTTVSSHADHGLTDVLGIAFGADGTMYLVGNDSTGLIGTASIARGIPSAPGSDSRVWSRVATTVPFIYGHVYNHRMSGIILNPTGDSIYVNSGAATDHGEYRDGGREYGLTSIILRLPVSGQNITLMNDREWLRSNGYLMAEGIRNTFDFAYAGNGDLFGPDNSGDRDDPEELNWFREGHHYGFPWRMGGNNTPQQFTPYNPHTDPLLSPNAWGGGGGNLYVTFSNDSTYPRPPAGVVFDEPIPSSGPDADGFRDTVTGVVKDASKLSATITTFTPHRSPDGIVFDRDSALAGDLKGGGFVTSVSNNSEVTTLGDTTEDVLFVALTKSSGSYTARVTKLVTGFNSPMGIERIANKLFVLETGLESPNPSPKLWEITLPASPTTSVASGGPAPVSFEVSQNYPNPFNPSTAIEFSLPRAASVSIEIFNTLGQHVRTLLSGAESAGRHVVLWDGKDSEGLSVGSGMYLYRMTAGNDVVQTRKMLLVR